MRQPKELELRLQSTPYTVLQNTRPYIILQGDKVDGVFFRAFRHRVNNAGQNEIETAKEIAQELGKTVIEEYDEYPVTPDSQVSSIKIINLRASEKILIAFTMNKLGFTIGT